MSDSQEPPTDVDMDPGAAMREMMGFSSFTTRPKNRSETSLRQNPFQTPASEAATHEEQETLGISDPSTAAVSDFVTLPGDQQQQQPAIFPGSDASASFQTRQQTNYAFISQQTGISYTRDELEEWTQGKVNERGDKVYFKPGFVIDDPWFRLRTKGKDKDESDGRKIKGNKSWGK